jgi:hypothetical protein
VTIVVGDYNGNATKKVTDNGRQNKNGKIIEILKKVTITLVTVKIKVDNR